MGKNLQTLRNNVFSGLKKKTSEKYLPGKKTLPPEVREFVKKGLKGYPIVKYDLIKNNDTIVEPIFSGFGEIILYGHNSQIHRWGTGLDEIDFFRQERKIKNSKKKKVTIGVRRTNFSKLDKIVSFIRKSRNTKGTMLPKFSITPLENLGIRFQKYLSDIREIVKNEKIILKITDEKLFEVFDTVHRKSKVSGFEEKEMLLALGPVCKEVFTGPRNILIDLMGKCNLDCVYCRKFSPWNKDYWIGQSPELFDKIDFDIVKNVINDAKELKTETIILVGGAEPTMHPRFKEIIEMITKKEMDYTLSTNGSLLNIYAKDILNSSCKEVCISLSFSSDKSWRAIHPNSGINLKKKIEKNVRILSDMKKKSKNKRTNIKGLYVITKTNYTEIIDMVYHAKKIGVDSIWFQLVHLEKFSREKLFLSPEEMKTVRTLLGKARDVASKEKIEFRSFIDFEIEHYDEKKGDWSDKGLLHTGCYVLWIFSFIGIRGDVFSCCATTPVAILPKTGIGLKEIWYGDAYARYRNDGLIMHKENPVTLYGQTLYNNYCNSCDNHDQNTTMINSTLKYDLSRFVER